MKKNRPKLYRGQLDPRTETLLPLDRLRHLVTGKPSYEAIYSWCAEGRNARGTQRVAIQMEAMYGTSGVVSSIEAYYRFLEKLNA